MAKASPDKPWKLARKIAKLDRNDMARMFKLLEKRLRKRAENEGEHSSALYMVAYSCHAADDILRHPVLPKKKK